MSTLLKACNGGVAPTVDLSEGLVAHYLLNNNADDSHGNYDGTPSGGVDFQGDRVDPLSGSITIPNTGGVWCSYWVDSGSGMVFTTSSTIPTSLATNKYSNLRVYNEVKDQTFIDALYAEGYYPKPLPLPTTTNLIAHYPLTGTAEDTTGNHDGTENGVTYIDDPEFGSLASFDGDGDADSILTTYTPGPTSATYCAWFKINAGDKDNAILGAFDNTYSSNGILIWYDDISGITSNTDIISVLITTGVDIPNSIWIESSNISLNTWYHMAVVYERGIGMKIYINGIDDTQYIQNATGTNESNAPVPLIIGDDDDPYARDMNGNIRNVRVYEEALSAQEIEDIYNYEKNFRPIDIDDGLVAYYPLAQNSMDNYYNELDGTDTAISYDGLSATFNGTSSYIQIGGGLDIFKTQQHSMSVWFKPNTLVPLGTVISNHYRPSGSGSSWNSGSRIYVNYAGTVVAQIILPITETITDSLGHEGTSYTAFAYTDAGFISVGEWCHAVIVVDGGKVELYLNGVLHVWAESATQEITWGTYEDNYAIGAENRDGAIENLFDGDISKSRHFDKVLLAEQVQAIYNSEKGDFE